MKVITSRFKRFNKRNNKLKKIAKLLEIELSAGLKELDNITVKYFFIQEIQMNCSSGDENLSTSDMEKERNEEVSSKSKFLVEGKEKNFFYLNNSKLNEFVKK